MPDNGIRIFYRNVILSQNIAVHSANMKPQTKTNPETEDIKYEKR